MNNGIDSIRADLGGLHSLTDIDGLWDEVDRQIDELYEESELAVTEAKGAALAAFALGCRIFVENPHGLDATGELNQSPAEDGR